MADFWKFYSELDRVDRLWTLCLFWTKEQVVPYISEEIAPVVSENLIPEADFHHDLMKNI